MINIQNVGQMDAFGSIGVGKSPNVAEDGVRLFEGFLGGLENMKETQESAKMGMAEVLLGNSENAHNTLINLEKANLQMQFASTVRDKVVQGVNQLLNMQV